MNNVKIILKNYNNKPIMSDISNFSFEMSKYNVEYVFKDTEIYLVINSKENFLEIYNYFMIHYKLLFLNNGYFYKIEEYRENDKIVDLKKYTDIDAYITNTKYIKNYQITNIKTLINEKTIEEFKKIENKFELIFYAFYYIHSDRYKLILCDHKFMILSQLCEGYIENSNHEKDIKEANFKGRIEIYVNLLNEINKKSNSEIFEVLKKDPEKIKEEIKNTRHKYSHYIEKKNTIHGNNFIYIYYILELAFRLLVLSDMRVEYGNELKENLYSLHDWIMETNCTDINLEDYKSLTYKFHKKTRKML